MKKILFAFGVFFLILILTGVSMLIYFLWGYKSLPKTNFLILGAGQEAQRGNLLTDTMIFTSVGSSGSILVSLPRDLWYTPAQSKINAIYHYGEKENLGFPQTKKAIQEILGQEVDYVLYFDFDVFRDLVDLVGGVEINVERAFDDDYYPIAGREDDLCDGDPEFKCRFESLHFEAGWQKMDGVRALKYVRSRRSEGDEGTDTARAWRQQKVIQALKQKILSWEFLSSIKKIQSLWQIYQQSVKTDMPQKDILPLFKLILKSRAWETSHFVIDGWDKEDGLLYHPKIHSSGQWVLLPKEPGFGEIHGFVNCLTTQIDKSLCSRR